MQEARSRKQGENDTTVHRAVLLHEVTGYLADLPEHSPDIKHAATNRGEMTYLDGTLGGGGHARAIAAAFAAHREGRHIRASDLRLMIIGLDRDPAAIRRAEQTLKGFADRLILVHEDYRNLDRVLASHGITAVDRILLDLGISSDELDTSGRGFSFQKDEPLQMTMDEAGAQPFTAADIVNGWQEETLADIIFAYGEERYARRIARAIVAYREKTPIRMTTELAEIVSSAMPAYQRRGAGRPKIHPATKTFQALRIAVNDELGALREGLAKAYAVLAPQGRLAVISFHSLEDRIVKTFFKDQAAVGARILTKKPVTPTPQEKAENPRSRSAKLRVLEKDS